MAGKIDGGIRRSPHRTMVKRLGEFRRNPVFHRPSGFGATSPFVGRVEEFRRLAEALSLAAEGQGGIIFLTGQRGIGKTRLAREVLALAKGHGFRVLEGRAYPLEVGLAYAPILDAFGPLLRSLDRDHLAVLTAGLPDLGRLFDGLRLPTPFFSERLGDPAFEKTRLFESVSRLLERLMQETPVVLFIDDLDSADLASLELLHYLARGLFGQRALLLATYGDDALDTSRVLRTLVGSLQRDWLVQEIVLKRLRPDAVEKLISGILGGEAPGDLLPLLIARSGGTPLFVEALIGALVESGNLVRTHEGWLYNPEVATALPPSVRRLILDRVERLEPDDRQVLDLIAIMGDATSHTLLRAAGGVEEGALLMSLRRLEAARFVVEETNGLEVAYSVAHPLFREVAYAELPEMARRQAHIKAIEALETFPEGRPDDVNRLARHYRAAGPVPDPERALAVLLAAGERARAVYANEEAAQHYVAALAMVREGQRSKSKKQGGSGSLPDPCPLTLYPQLPWLLERLGEVWERIGKHEAAMEAWNEALVERERTGDALAAARLRRELAVAEWDRGHFDLANAHATAGFAALAGREPCQELVDLHRARFFFLGRLGDAAGMADTATELLAVAERLASPRAEAEANLVAATFSLGQGDVDTACQRALHGLRVAESFSEGQELAICCRAYAILVSIGMRMGDHRFMRNHIECGLTLSRRLGVPHFDVVFRLRMAYANFLCGAWDESLRNSLEAIALARRVGHPRDLAIALAGRAMILARQGHLAEAEACILEVKVVFGSRTPVDRYVFGVVDIAEMAIALERGDAKRALSIAKGFARPSGFVADAVGLTTTYLSIGLALLAEAQAVAGEPKSALETARNLADLGPLGAPYSTALASRAEGLARLAMGQVQAAIDCLARAYDKFTALGIPFEAARSLLEQAGAAAAQQPLVAATAAQQSLIVFEHLGACSYADRAGTLLRGLGISPTRPHRTRLNGSVLTARELEIARLVAEGLPTPEIAKRLILSPLTVSNHLHHIYTRLGIRSRAALARYVTGAGLA